MVWQRELIEQKERKTGRKEGRKKRVGKRVVRKPRPLVLQILILIVFTAIQEP